VLVIHTLWAYGALQVWAEDSSLPPHAPPRAGRPSRAPRPHPFAAAPDVLADVLATALASTGAGDLPGKAVDDEITLRLPSAADGPLASAELLVLPADDEDVRAARRLSLTGWRVPVLGVEPADAAPLLAALAGVTPGDIVASGSVGYLAAVARFAADLAARGRVLPALTEEDGGYAARWRPVLSAADARHARELAAAMPPACRAVSNGTGADGGGAVAEPGPLLAAMLDALADTAVRTRLPGALLPARRGRPPARTAIAERMLLALTAPQPLIEVADADDEREARELAAAFADWLASAALPGGSVRTCFRLVEPLPAAEPADRAGPAGGAGPAEAEEDAGPAVAADPGGWRVEFSLQSAADPSLMLPAADVWAGAGYGWLRGMLPQHAGHPEEELLAGLGTAARLFPALDAALREAAPAEVTLDTAGALDFLRETGPLLSGAGFGVLMPDWARKARLGLKLTARSASSGPAASGRQGQFGLQDLVSFRYDLALGDDVLSGEELAELARLKVPLVRVRGQWVELDDRHLKAALKFLEANRSGTMTAAEVLGVALGADAPPGDLPLTGVAADGWLGDLLSGQADERLGPAETPAGFHGALRPYQQRGLSWLAFLGRLGIGAVLADDMGLGKTVQLLALLSSGGTTPRTPRCPAEPGPMAKTAVVSGPSQQDESSGETVGPTLLICPMSLVGNWQREAERFTPGLAVHVHHGADRLAGTELAAAVAGADLVITTYQTAVRDLAALSQVRWARVVCDEAQAIKNHLSRQSKAVRSLPAASRIALTGTPVENQLSELWSIMEFANPGMLGAEKAFRERYAVPIERHGSDEAARELRRVTQPFVLRRLKTDKSIISDLPAKQEMKVWCNLTQEQASLYAATVADMLSRIDDASDDITRRGLVLATMSKLKQVCNHPAHLLGDGSRLPGRSGKLARLEELCEEIAAEGDKALCFTQYAEFGRMLQPHLAARTGCPVLFLHGGTPKKQRDAMVARFQEAGEPMLFLLSLKAGGTGLNLTAANHVIHVDRWWNPAVEDQATDRAFRIGQRRDVQVRKFVCVGTLEERIDAMIEQKKALAEQVVGTGEGWLTELSTAALREVLTLSPEAVSS
jgi:SNF2-related domain/SNF2 Helicase protein/Helicase conserved C-terminal domain